MRRLTVCIAAVLFLPGLTGCERAKTQFDREVDRLCAIDGGVHVYEKVVLPKENFDENGRITSKFKQSIGAKTNDASLYQSRIERKRLAEKNKNIFRTGLSLSRARLYVVRVADGKILGDVITYIRGGGDFYGLWEGSNYICPRLPIDPIDAVFVKGYQNLRYWDQASGTEILVGSGSDVIDVGTGNDHGMQFAVHSFRSCQRLLDERRRLI